MNVYDMSIVKFLCLCFLLLIRYLNDAQEAACVNIKVSLYNLKINLNINKAYKSNPSHMVVLKVM
jgi:hypothetical protein